MLRYILKRILMLIPVLVGITVIVFTLLYFTPGDPASMVLGIDASTEQLELFRQQHGLDKPYGQRLLKYMGDVFLRMDFGISLSTKQPVVDELAKRLPNTMILTFAAVIIGSAIGIISGIISAVKQYSIFDKIGTYIALFGVSAPTFWVALMFVLVFAVHLRWLPPTGSYGFKYWILPSVTLGLWASGTIMRMTRSAMLDVIRQDYIRTARAKGQTEFVITVKHALRNSLIPIITVIGLQLTTLFAGAILTESVFSIPGIGKYMVDSINNRDFQSVQGGVLFLAFICVITNLITDIIYSFVDPRIKSQYSSAKKKEINKQQGSIER